MKKIVLVIFFMFLALFIKAQNNKIDFESLTYNQVLKQSEEQGKLIFLYFYTDKCSACTKISQNTFSNESVISYFNNNFINHKINCSPKSSGIEIAKKYEVNAFPSLVFINYKEEMVDFIVGAVSSEKLLSIAKGTKVTGQNLSFLKNEFEKGNRNEKLVNDYLKKLKQANKYREASTIFKEYFSTLSDKDKISKNTWDLLLIVGTYSGSEIFKFIEKHKKKYYMICGKEHVNKYIKDIYTKDFIYSRTGEDRLKILKAIKKGKYSFGQEISEFYDVINVVSYVDYYDKKHVAEKIKKYTEKANVFLEKYGDKNIDYYRHIIYSLLPCLGGFKDCCPSAIKWCEKLLEKGDNYNDLSLYAYIFQRNHRWKEYFAALDKLKKYCIKNNISYADIDYKVKATKKYLKSKNITVD